jgi:midasin (ATPase involved in ribosome maturation)
MLLAERLRIDEEKNEVKYVLETELKVKINVDTLYDAPTDTAATATTTTAATNGTTMSMRDLGSVDQLHEVQRLLDSGNGATHGLKGVALTHSLRRLFRLVGRCLENNEPVLLVGDTGCGKTTVCQLFALLLNRPLHVVNCHASTEAADLLGGLRPVRGRDTLTLTLKQKCTDFTAVCEQWLQRQANSSNSGSMNGHTVSITEGNNTSTATSADDMLHAAEVILSLCCILITDFSHDGNALYILLNSSKVNTAYCID